ncbi:FecR family protein, partial [Treponema sp. R80B11-R83G3]
LQSGKVRVEVKPPAGTKTNLNVQSPSATASVRGTTFEMDAYNLYGIEGKILFTGVSGAGVLVTGGNSSSSNADGTVSDPKVNAENSVKVLPPIGVDIEMPSRAKASNSEMNIIVNYP